MCRSALSLYLDTTVKTVSRLIVTTQLRQWLAYLLQYPLCDQIARGVLGPALFWLICAAIAAPGLDMRTRGLLLCHTYSERYFSYRPAAAQANAA